MSQIGHSGDTIINMMMLLTDKIHNFVSLLYLHTNIVFTLGDQSLVQYQISETCYKLFSTNLWTFG